MRDGPTKIDFDVNDLAFAHGDDLGIAETSAVCVTTFISHEYPFAIGNEIDKIETLSVSLFGQQRAKYVARSIRLSSGLVKWKSGAISASIAARSLLT